MKKSHQDFSDIKFSIQTDDTNLEETFSTKSIVSQKEDDDVMPLFGRGKRPSIDSSSSDKLLPKKICMHHFLLKSRTGESTVEPFYLFNTNVDVVKAFIHYLYTDTIHSDAYNISKKKMIPLAVLFHIDRLKYECLAHAVFNLTSENILQKYSKACESKETVLIRAILFTMAYSYPKLVARNFEENTPEYTILVTVDERLRQLYQRMSGQYLIRRALFLEHRLADIIPPQTTAQTSPLHKINLMICGPRGAGVSTFVEQAKSVCNDLKSLEGVNELEVSFSATYITDKHFPGKTASVWDAVILIFAIDNIDSFNAIRKKNEDFRFFSKAPTLIVGNKCDVISFAFETEESILGVQRIQKEINQDMKSPYFEISGRNLDQVKLSIEEAVREALYYRHITCRMGFARSDQENVVD